MGNGTRVQARGRGVNSVGNSMSWVVNPEERKKCLGGRLVKREEVGKKGGG